jgi:anaerobic magnesium-protoporphyrin IX monomethyl ester cyclase
VRVFFVQDDLFVLPNEAATIERMEALRESLRSKGVEHAVFWIKGRPESITPAVLRAARALGAIHMFLGVESASIERLRYLGRVHTPEDNRRAIALCREFGVRPSFNFMLFDPDCALQDIALTLDLAQENLDLAWNVCRTEIYSGTRLLDRLRGEGRLLGDYRSYGYRMRDERAEVMFRILRVSFHQRAFAFDSLLNKLISLSFSSQLHEALFAGVETSSLAAKVQELLTDAHQDTVQSLRATLDYAARADVRDAEGVKHWALDDAMRVNSRDLAYHARFDRLWSELHARGMSMCAKGQ